MPASFAMRQPSDSPRVVQASKVDSVQSRRASRAPADSIARSRGVCPDPVLAFPSPDRIVMSMTLGVLKPASRTAAGPCSRENKSRLLRRARRLIARLSEQWQACPFVAGVDVVFDTRLRTSVACYSRRQKRIKLNVVLLAQPHFLPEVVGHELAHLVVFARYGLDCRPHGPEWRQLMRSSGLVARRTVRIPMANAEGSNRTPRSTAKYTHRCPVCQARWTAKRRMTRWRCSSCMESGLSGELIVERKD